MICMWTYCIICTHVVIQKWNKSLRHKSYCYDSWHDDLVKPRVWEKNVVTKWKYLNYISCGLAHESVACFCNVCVTEKKNKKPCHIRGQFSRWLHHYYNKFDVTSQVFPNPVVFLKVNMGSVFLKANMVMCTVWKSHRNRQHDTHFRLCDVTQSLLNMHKRNRYLPAIYFDLDCIFIDDFVENSWL